jgi:DNA ligase D-like protein (predicted ligase)
LRRLRTGDQAGSLALMKESGGSALDLLTAEERGKLRRSRQPRWIEPMKAVLHDRPFSDPEWIFERKLDGVRCLAFRQPREVRLLSRTDKLLNRSYPELVEALEGEGCEFVIDGEIVAFSRHVTSFSRLQRRMQISDPERARRTGIAIYHYVFDILHLNGYDTTRLPLRARKQLLRAALDFHGPVRFLSHRNRDGEALFADACQRGLEGLIAKRAASRYVRTRSSEWLKLKCSHEQELVIGGFTTPHGKRTHFGALLVGYYEDGGLRYAGKVGTGFDQRTLADLGARMRKLERPDPPFVDVHPVPKGAHWIEPRLVGQFAFTEWTRDGRLRHPRYLGLRDDKRPREVVRERPTRAGARTGRAR